MTNSEWESLRRETAGRLEAVRRRIDAAAGRSGRGAEAVKLVAVTKYASGHEGFEAALSAAGCSDFGENRPQRLLDKWRYFAEVNRTGGAKRPGQTADRSAGRESSEAPIVPRPDSIRWHFIGSLQRNKVRRLLPHAALIHSVDTPDLFEAIDRIMREEAEKTETVPRKTTDADSVSDAETAVSAETAAAQIAPPPFPDRIPILLEVNISGEGNKHGFQPDDLLDRAGFIFERPGKTLLRGLMGMGGLESSPADVRRQFARLRRLFEDVRRAFPALTDFTELSMGMSGDFETAIEEGATLVRIGSILYPDRF